MLCELLPIFEQIFNDQKIMKRIIPLVILIFISLFASLLKAKNPVRATISMGTSTPLKPFSSRDFSDSHAGFANQGFVVNVDGDFFLNNRFALTGRMHLNNNPIDQASYFTKLDHDVLSYMPDSSKNAFYNEGNWLWIAPMAGIKYNYPLILNKAWVEVGLFSGVQFSKIPDQNMVVEDEVTKERIITKNLERSDIVFPLAIEGGLRMNINRLTQLSLKAAYYHSKVDYTHVSYKVDANGAQVGETINQVNQSVQTNSLQFTLGLSYRLNE